VPFPRSSGLLLHPTALPGPFACGDLGSGAHAFVDFLAGAGQSLWQVLPLGPTGLGDSPYQCFSAFAGNPLLVSPARLAEEGLISRDELARLPSRIAPATDYGRAHETARAVAWALADRMRGHALRHEFEAFRARTPWLADFASFMALRDAQGGASWSEWPASLRAREPGALAEARRTLAPAIRAHEVMQWAFARQWGVLREHAHARGVRILGDAPIFVAFDSADVWARPELFELDAGGRPTGVAGVPPDYFSATGQLWGNPLYRWEAHAREHFSWWGDRLAWLLDSVDLVRLDHFIGFVRYWDVPPDAPDARGGSWQPGPGEALFHALRQRLRALPIVAEDLGAIDEETAELRESLGLPGMCVLQFAFDGDAENPFLPRNHAKNRVVYTGTHDNDTTRGWWERASEAERDTLRAELGAVTDDVAWDLIAAGMGSVAHTFVAPVQDVLSLGSEARFNTPGTAAGNWAWRLAEGQLGPAHAERLRALAAAHGRLPPSR
jgi:4-alpha-glucanotransferase